MTAFARPGVRIAAFVAGLAVIFAAAFGVGTAVGPWDTDSGPTHGPAGHHVPMDQEGASR